jgi:hypothetical protein
MDRDKKHPLSSQAAEIVLIVGPMRGKSGSRKSRVENNEWDKSKPKTSSERPFVPYAIYDYLAGAHDLAPTVEAIRQILDADRVDRAYFCRWLRERFDRLIAALDAP